MPSLIGRVVTSDGAELLTRHWAADDPWASLLLVHGLGEHSGRYEHVGEHLAAAGIDAHAYDQRGNGASDGARGDIDRWSRFHDDLEDRLGSVRAAAAGLPVVLYAHSMGGLVARSLIVEAPDVWSDLGASSRGDSGRLLMLGTPNHGSFSIVLTLTGTEMIVKALAAIDCRADRRALVDVIATFPGVYQMLPAPGARPVDDDHAEIFRSAAWGGRWPVDPRLLDDAASFHRTLEENHEKLTDTDRRRMTSVAGYGHPTPYRLEVADPGVFSIGRIRRGDGRVALDLNELDGVTRYYCEASHGQLVSDRAVLDSLPALLSGKSGTLKMQVPEFRGAEAIDRPPMVPIGQFDPEPGAIRRGRGQPVDRHEAEVRLAEALLPSVGGQTTAALRRVRVEVRVVHGSLEQARFPVAVGHYAGLPIDGAEKFLDKKLGGVLRRRLQLAQYPEGAGNALCIPGRPGQRPEEALVLGLGEFGTLTAANLTAAMTQAVTALVLDRRDRDADPTDAFDIGVSSVIIGSTGRHGLSIEDSITALVERVIQSAVRLRGLEDPVPVRTIELEVLDRYEQPAEEAAMVVGRLEELLEQPLLDQVDLVASRRLEIRDGFQPGYPRQEGPGNAWVRVLVALDPADQAATGSSHIRRMTFSTLARGAQANLIEHEVDLDKIAAYVDAAVRHPEKDPAVNRTLFELLFPPRAKLDLDRSEHLHLIVDKETAQLPWELLTSAAAGGGVAPLALRAGMLRQLHSDVLTRNRAAAPGGLSALFVGDPPTSYPRLPNARREAESLAAMFESRKWDVERRIYDERHTGAAQEWMDVLNALYEKDHRVVHIAAHGVFDVDARSSGVALGPRPQHRLTALDFAAMSSTPDLVFLNCCHLGRLGSLLDEGSADVRALERPHLVAGTVAEQLLRNGVRAVVVAGWAVDDFAAAEFATKLYESLLDGYAFGEAVSRAREAARNADGDRSNTWGAYQCYGDPDFELVAREAQQKKPQVPVSAGQLVREFDLAAAKAGGATTEAALKAIAADVNVLQAASGDLLDDGRVLEALGRALSELGRYEEAVSVYEQALRSEKGEARLHTVEQLGNLLGRVAVQRSRNGCASGHDIEALFEKARSKLDLVKSVAPTAERCALRGSLEKKRATTLTGEARPGALEAARDAYRDAHRMNACNGRTRLVPYYTNNWLQLAALTSPSGTLSRNEAGYLRALYKQVAAEAGASADYWEAAALADTLLTHLVAQRPISGRLVDAADLVENYSEAFRLRSTVRQRDSTLGHLEDLRLLVPAGEDAPYQKVLQELRSFHGT